MRLPSSSTATQSVNFLFDSSLGRGGLTRTPTVMLSLLDDALLEAAAAAAAGLASTILSMFSKLVFLFIQSFCLSRSNFLYPMVEVQFMNLQLFFNDFL